MNLDQREWCRLEMLIYVDKKRELTRKNKDYYWRNKLWNAMKRYEQESDSLWMIVIPSMNRDN